MPGVTGGGVSGVPDPTTLRIGRVLLPGVTFDRPTRSEDGMILHGTIEANTTFEAGSTLARAWRDDLTAHMRDRDVVPLVWGRRDEFDGFYIVRSVEMETWSPYTNYQFTVDLQYALPQVGGRSAKEVKFESKLDGTFQTNDFGVTTGAEPVHAPPIGHWSYDTRGTLPAFMTRNTAEGDIRVYRDVDYLNDVQWSANAEDFLLGAALIERI